MSEVGAHYSVMLEDVLGALNLKEEGCYLDCTFGRGGYARAVLEGLETTKVIAFDRDETAKEAASDLKKKYGKRFSFYPMCFDQMADVLSKEEKLDGIMFDLGVSSPQLDRPERGFSFRFEGPLDMRMGTQGITAAEVVNTYGESELADLIYLYGEEKKSRIVAAAIVMDRREKLFETTTELAELLRRIVPKSKDGIDPATRTFQALRIHVNDELGQLERALESALTLLKRGGRLVVVSFHSLEDRIVKKFMVKHSKKASVNRYVPQVIGALDEKPVLKIVSRKALLPRDQEVKENPRSRSAKLRVAEYLGGGDV